MEGEILTDGRNVFIVEMGFFHYIISSQRLLVKKRFKIALVSDCYRNYAIPPQKNKGVKCDESAVIIGKTT